MMSKQTFFDEKTPAKQKEQMNIGWKLCSHVTVVTTF